MVTELKPENLSDIRPLLQKYVDHISDSITTIEGQMNWFHTGLSNGNLCILCEYDESDNAIGFLVHSIKSGSTAVIFAGWNFQIERLLFDDAFNRFSPDASFLTFESGYPTPWISGDLAAYALEVGFSKYDRQYMRIERSNEPLTIDLGNQVNIIQYSDSMLEEVSELVFKSVDGTDDQDLFPYVYGTYETTLQFHTNLTRGDFGTHKESYSWVLEKDETLIGSCFMLGRKADTGGVMHISILPKYRRQGLGRSLLTHSIANLYLVEPDITGIDLAVTSSNPAILLYESLGFVKVNDSSTYVWRNMNNNPVK
ncbi:MAG: GNAT family N-acetyltransferase [Candidatus Thorarchaeota archaeon]|jgi:ribosomal protein S18 acetylase RimI-like enzyme